MYVKMLQLETIPVDKRTSKNYTVDWSGEVDDVLATAWIKKGSAVRTTAKAAKPKLTDAETAVLKAAAQQALKGTGESVDPETGEVLDDDSASDAGDDGDASREDGKQSPAEVLASMTRKELDALAKQHGIRATARSRKDVEADILAKLAAEG